MYIGKKRVFYLTMGILCYMSNMAFAETVDTNVNKVDGEINTHVVTVTAKRLEATDLATPAIVDVYTQEDIQRTGAATHMMYCRILQALFLNRKGLMAHLWGR